LPAGQLKRIYLGLAIHNHQPVGNFPWVFEQAYRQSYLPMLESLERHPAVRLSMHYSGCLLDWLEETHPEFLSRLAKLVQRGQVEIMGGAYYEPILPAIPDDDKAGQIAKMTEFLRRKFGQVARGFWLAERVWEPHLAKVLADAGLEWTLVDDCAFKSLGLKDQDLFGYYITEEQGRHVKLFPISRSLRYSVPWRNVAEVIDYLKNAASVNGDKIAVFGDDGEKFGIWPGTHKLCWLDGWVDNFFAKLEANREWLCTIPLGEYVALRPPLGRIYLPCASYEEMLEWSLPAYESWEYSSLKKWLETEGREDIRRYMYCGLWRNFLVKYPEVNRMYRKMLLVHSKVHRARATGKSDHGLEDLWKAQCNCPYWHGIFGGIYLADIRATTYRHLIQAENKADEVLRRQRRRLGKSRSKSSVPLECRKFDFDGDGADELLVESDVFALYFSLKEGGSIFEWDLRCRGFNLLSTMARRPEAYHFALKETATSTGEADAGVRSIHDSVRIKDSAAVERLVYDAYPRSSLMDRFFSPGVSMDDFCRGNFREMGDFVGEQFDVAVKTQDSRVSIELCRQGKIELGHQVAPFHLRKLVMHKCGEEVLQVIYELKNTSSSVVEVMFGSEWNINLLGGGHNQQAYFEVPDFALSDYLDSRISLDGVHRVLMGNRQLDIGLEMKISPGVRLWLFPVESISNSEGGVEGIYQASCLVLCLPLLLAPGEVANLAVEWVVS